MLAGCIKCRLRPHSSFLNFREVFSIRVNVVSFCLCDLLFLLLEMSSSTVFSHTDKFEWTCRQAESFTFDSDGKTNLYIAVGTVV